MNTKLAETVFRFLFLFAFVLGTAGLSGESAEAQMPDPFLRVNLNGDNPNRVNGEGWVIGESVYVAIDDPVTLANPDSQLDGVPVIGCGYDPSIGCFKANFNGMYQIKAGDLVTATQGSITKTHEVLYIEITEVNALTDVVSGMTEPFIQVRAMAWPSVGSGATVSRDIMADGFGNWSVDFTDDDPQTADYDLVSGTYVRGDRFDEDNDATSTMGWIPLPPGPVFMLNVWNDSSWHEITAWNWPLGAQVTLSVDDPDTLQNPDYSETKIMEPRSGSHATGATYLQNNEFEGQPGFTIALSDGVQTKTMIVPLLQGTEYDLEADTVSGLTNPFARVVVACDEGAEPTVTADSEGNWTANFRDPENPEVVLYDVRPGTWCEPQMYDQDRDHIVLRDWYVPLPTIEALGTNQLAGSGWPLGMAVTMTIDDPTNGIGVDHTVVQMPFEEPEYPEGSLRVPLPVEHFLKPGHIIQATNGDITKTLIYAYQEVTEIDTDSDIIRGKAEPGANLHVQIHGSGGIFLDVTTDANGDWVADFQDVYNLTPNTRGDVSQSDMDGDTVTHYFGSPKMVVYLLEDLIQGLGWKLGTNVTLTIDDPSNGVGIDLTETKIVEVAWWNPSETEVGFATYDLGIHPGQLMVLTDGVTTKSHVVSHLGVTEINTWANTVAGITDPGGIVEVGRMCDDLGCAIRRVAANTDGGWLADFSVPGEESDEQDLFDILPGTLIKVIQKDNYGNWDTLFLDAPQNTTPNADAGYDRVGYVNSAIPLDASSSSDPDGDTLTYAWDLDNDGEYDDASDMTVTTSFSQVGDHIIGLMVKDEDGLSDTDTITVTILPWTLTGFYQPVDMNGVYNTVKGGSTVPLKFEIFAGSNEIVDIAAVKNLTYAETACNANAVTDEIELTATGGTSLRYDAQSGLFIYNWKTPRTAGKCYRVTMTTMDGSSLMAYFKLK